MRKNYVSVGAIVMALAIALGAFGAHFIKNRYDAYSQELWSTSTQYLFYHAIGIIILGLIPLEKAHIVAMLWIFGIVVFCGTLYAIALGGPKWLGALTPIGGTAWIVAWLLLAYLGWQK
jgi:uncharacterized membrane protein YgdD (TMEM256/DUF423 family)